MDTPANNPQFRPPAEADSLILQVDEGCPYNRCTFCGMYRHLRYRQRPLPALRAMINDEMRHAPDTRRVFLADGDVMRRPFADLQALLRMLNEAFPCLARVNAYATGSALLAKSDTELRALRDLRLHTLYLGLESGDEETLRAVRKGETAAAMIEAGQLAQACGLRISVMILLGLGGQARMVAHARATAAALNAMQPRLLSALRLIPIPGTELHGDIGTGRFQPVTERQAVEELQLLVQDLALTNTVFRANHSSNIIPLEARLPRDQARLLAVLDKLLAGGELDEQSPGTMPLWL